MKRGAIGLLVGAVCGLVAGGIVLVLGWQLVSPLALWIVGTAVAAGALAGLIVALSRKEEVSPLGMLIQRLPRPYVFPTVLVFLFVIFGLGLTRSKASDLPLVITCCAITVIVLYCLYTWSHPGTLRYSLLGLQLTSDELERIAHPAIQALAAKLHVANNVGKPTGLAWPLTMPKVRDICPPAARAEAGRKFQLFEFGEVQVVSQLAAEYGLAVDLVERLLDYARR